MTPFAQLNRKRFLELVSTMAGSTVLATQMPWFSIFNNPSGAGQNASDRIRVGFIGIGSRGRTLLLNVQELQHMNVEIVAVCDNYEPHKERAVQMTEGKAQGFLDYKEMLDKVPLDAVIIASPLHEHARMTVDSMNAGAHVYVEKSMARTLDDVKWMYDTYLDTGKIMLIGHQRLFSPVNLQAIDMINRGDIGQVTMLAAHWTRNIDWVRYDVPGGRGSAEDRIKNWRLYWEYSAGMVTELGAHDFQVANWILDAQPVSVIGSGSLNYWKDGREVHDNFSLTFKYPKDIHLSYFCTQSNKHNGQSFQVMGKDGTLDLFQNRMYEENPPQPPAIKKMLHSIETSVFELIPIGGATWIPADPSTYAGNTIVADYKPTETLLYLEAFMEYIRKGSAPRKLTDQGYHASTWALCAEQASRTGNEITLPKRYII